MNYFDPTFAMPSEQVDKSLAVTIRAKIRAWITSKWFVDLVHMFGGDVDYGDLDRNLQQLEAFSDRWDFRRIARERGASTDDNLQSGMGSARWLSATTGLSANADARIIEAARHLGLVQATEPSRSSYDYVIVLGGARLSCKLRPLRAAEIVRSGIDVAAIGLLGAARPIPDSERDATDTYAPGARNEFDLIVAGSQEAFGFNANDYEQESFEHPSVPNLSWMVRKFCITISGRTLPIAAYSAPSTEPLLRRANSADTILFFLEHENVRARTRLLLITSQVYVPYVQLEALRTVAIQRQIVVETIGFPGDRMPELQGLTNANHYLQEIRSAIQAARRFCAAYPE